MSIRDTIRQNREKILAVAAKHGASNVRVFGSVSRGDETDASDVDFLVVLQPGRSLLDHAALKVELEEFLDRPVDIATERGLKPKYRERIISEAVAI